MTWKLEVAANAAATLWTDYTSVVDRSTLRVGGTAHENEIDAGSGFDLADDAGSIVLPSRRVWRVIEDATTPDTVLGGGRLVRKELARGLRFDANAHQKDVLLQDSNSHLGGIGFVGTHRPAETDHARVRFFLETHLQGAFRASTDIADTYLQTTSPVNLPAHSYSDIDLPGIFAHILGLSGKEMFITVDDELFYGPTTSTVYAAGLSITDDDPDLVTEFPPIEAAGSQDGTELFTRVRVLYSNRRTVNVEDTAQSAAHDRWQTQIVDDSIKTTATAIARAQTLLGKQKVEETGYSCAILLRADQVHLVKKGQTLSFRSAAAGVLTPLTLRVKHLVWEVAGPGHYLARLELNFPKKIRARTGSGSTNPGTPTPTGPVPFVPGEATTAEFSAGIGSEVFGYPPDPDGRADWYTEHGGSLVALEQGAQYRLVFTQTSSFGSDGGTNFNFMQSHNLRIEKGAEGAGGGTTEWLDPGTMLPSSIYPWATTGPWTVGKVYQSPWRVWNGSDGQLVDFGQAGVGLSGYWGYQLDGVLRLEKRGGSGAGAEDDPVGTPAEGQPVIDSVGSDGTADPGSPTTYPYAPGSLVIYVNGVNMAAELTELDPEAGTYEFAHPIPEGAEIQRYYLGTGAGAQ